MTGFHSPSSQDPTNAPSFIAAAPPRTSAISSRPFPQPCWSQEETVSLIDAYRDKWYSLRRGNLRASDWQEVATDVANRCPLSPGNPQKTSTQCRHKMEKLRKRYRAEIQRFTANPKGHGYSSSWFHFKQMDLMEKGSTASDPVTVSMYQDEDEESEERDCYSQDGLLLYPVGIKQATATPPNKRFHNIIDRGNGFRIKIPPPQEGGLNRAKLSYGVGKGLRYGHAKRGFPLGGGRRVEMVGDVNNPVKEMVAAINKLGDGFVRIEKMKIDMAKELESMRLELEMKRTEMIIESHQRLADSFSNQGNKKLKSVPAPES